MRTAAWVQLTVLGRDDAPCGLMARGDGPLDRVNEADGGWVHLRAPGTWYEVRDAATDAPESVEDAEAWLAERIAALTPGDAVAWASGLGLMAQEVLGVSAAEARGGRPEWR